MRTIRSIEWRYYTVLFLFWFSTALPMAVFILLAQARGMNLAQIGLLTAMYSATIVLLEVPTGGLADSLGRARVALLAEFVTLAGWSVFLLSFSFPAFVVAFLLNGVGRALASGSIDAWFVDSLLTIDPEIDLHPRLSRAGAITLLALGTGAMSGGTIVHWFSFLPPDGTAVLTPLSSPGVVALPIRIALMIAIFYLIREPRRRDGVAASWKKGIADVPRLLRDAVRLTSGNGVLIRLLALSGASGLVLSSLEVLWQPHFGRLLGNTDIRSVLLGVLLAVSFLVGMIGNLASPKLTRWFGGRPGGVCALFHGLRGALLVGLALQTSAAPAAILFWLVYLGQGVVVSTNSLLLNQEIPPERRSSMLSIQSLVSYAGGFIGSAGLGLVADRTSIGLAWGIAGGVLLVSCVLYLRVDIVRKERLAERTTFSSQTDATSVVSR